MTQGTHNMCVGIRHVSMQHMSHHHTHVSHHHSHVSHHHTHVCWHASCVNAARSRGARVCFIFDPPLIPKKYQPPQTVRASVYSCVHLHARCVHQRHCQRYRIPYCGTGFVFELCRIACCGPCLILLYCITYCCTVSHTTVCTSRYPVPQ